ncbi:MAG: hypothetical protein D6824_01230, partial [Planctomycetota bacterium]
VWGGDRLRAWGKPVEPGAKVGESWEIADLASTDPSGAGGGAARSVVKQGPLAGSTLHEAMALWGADLLGRAHPAEGDSFPLLIKYLDAHENLSVQTHPSPAYAREHPEAHVKHECWTVLEATPNAKLYKGLVRDTTAAELAQAARDGSIVDLLKSHTATPGQCYTLPSGVVHALGAGVLVAEVQTPSDTTYRLYDWGRVGRALHIEQAVACARLEADAEPPTRLGDADPSPLAHTEAFTLDGRIVTGPDEISPLTSDVCVVWMLVQGRCAWLCDRWRHEAQQGDTVLVPARCAARMRARVEQGSATILEARPAPAGRNTTA